MSADSNYSDQLISENLMASRTHHLVRWPPTTVFWSAKRKNRKRRSAAAVAILLATTSLPIATAQQDMPPSDYSISRSQVEDLMGQTLGLAEAKSARPMSPLSLEMIKDFERWMPSAYNDPSGYCTIGFGHLIARAQCETIDLGEFRYPLTVSAGEQLLEKDTRTARAAVQHLVKVDLGDDQFGALVSFAFNIGKGNFERSTLLEFVNRGEVELAAKQFPRWVVSNGRVLNGLIVRRSCEAAMFRGDLKNKSHFRRSDCSSLGVAPNVGSLIDIEKGE